MLYADSIVTIDPVVSLLIELTQNEHVHYSVISAVEYIHEKVKTIFVS